jgi:hypothetical protein
MKTARVVLLFLAIPLAAQDTDFCRMHKHHMASSSDHHAALQRRGNEGMGFGQDKTTHHFRLYPDGGAIEVTAEDSSDIESVQAIRSHLTHIAESFSKGDFSISTFVHDQVPPGVPIMQQKRAKITYTYQETSVGGRVRIQTPDAEALTAVHDFLRFQIEEHRTGDSIETSSLGQ